MYLNNKFFGEIVKSSHTFLPNKENDKTVDFSNQCIILPPLHNFSKPYTFSLNTTHIQRCRQRRLLSKEARISSGQDTTLLQWLITKQSTNSSRKTMKISANSWVKWELNLIHPRSLGRARVRKDLGSA